MYIFLSIGIFLGLLPDLVPFLIDLLTLHDILIVDLVRLEGLLRNVLQEGAGSTCALMMRLVLGIHLRLLHGE